MPSTQCLIIMHSIVHMRTVFPCEKVRGSSGGVLTWYHGLGGGRLFGARVYQSMGRLLEEIWYLPHTCTDVAFASGMFLFWKILTCSTPKDTYEKLIEHDYLWIHLQLQISTMNMGSSVWNNFITWQKLWSKIADASLKFWQVLKVGVLSPFAMLVVEKGTNKIIVMS